MEGVACAALEWVASWECAESRGTRPRFMRPGPACARHVSFCPRTGSAWRTQSVCHCRPCQAAEYLLLVSCTSKLSNGDFANCIRSIVAIDVCRTHSAAVRHGSTTCRPRDSTRTVGHIRKVGHHVVGIDPRSTVALVVSDLLRVLVDVVVEQLLSSQQVLAVLERLVPHHCLPMSLDSSWTIAAACLLMPARSMASNSGAGVLLTRLLPDRSPWTCSARSASRSVHHRLDAPARCAATHDRHHQRAVCLGDTARDAVRVVLGHPFSSSRSGEDRVKDTGPCATERSCRFSSLNNSESCSFLPCRNIGRLSVVRVVALSG